MDGAHFVLVLHFAPACLAALLFFAGAGLAAVVARWGPVFLTCPALLLFKGVRRLMGERPGLLRMVLVIFGFNGAAMFLYMASGVRPAIPLAIDVLTGFNIAAILLLAGQESVFAPAPGSDAGGADRVAAGLLWIPSEKLTALCGLAVLLLELPCFWYSIALGVTLGREVVEGQQGYAAALSARGAAYVRLVLPALLVSALCEAVAIRGMQSRIEARAGYF